MNKLVSSLFFLSASFGLHAMQQQAKQLYIENQTPDKLIVHFQHSGELNPRAITLVPRQNYNLGNPDTLQLLDVTTYGRYKQWLTLHKLSFGYWPLTNLVDFVRKEIPGLGAAQNVTLLVQRRPYVGLVTPYKYGLMVGKLINPISILWDVFPQVKSISDENLDLPEDRKKRILARYFLNAGEDATPAQITQNYTDLVAAWTPKLTSTDPAIRDEARDVLRFLHAAYQSIINGGNYERDFNRIVAAEDETPTIYLVGEYTL